jgi:putative membrane protein
MNTIFSQVYAFRPMRGFGWDLLGFIFWVLVFGLIILLIIYFVSFHRLSTPNQPKSDPLEIAKTRYAKGEISKTEFNEIKKGLKD